MRPQGGPRDEAAPGSILVVDDHPHVITAVGRFLRPYRPILGAKSGTEAIGIIDGGVRLCGAIIDLNLGEGSDGIAVLVHLRAQWPSIPVIMLSGEMTTAAHCACLDHRAQHIPKGCASTERLASFGAACLLADFERYEAVAEVEAEYAARFGWNRFEVETVSNAVHGRTAEWYATAHGVPEPTYRSRVTSLLKKAGEAKLDVLVRKILWEALKRRGGMQKV